MYDEAFHKGIFLDKLGARGRSAGCVNLSDLYKFRRLTS